MVNSVTLIDNPVLEAHSEIMPAFFYVQQQQKS